MRLPAFLSVRRKPVPASAPPPQAPDNPTSTTSASPALGIRDRLITRFAAAAIDAPSASPNAQHAGDGTPILIYETGDMRVATYPHDHKFWPDKPIRLQFGMAQYQVEIDAEHGHIWMALFGDDDAAIVTDQGIIEHIEAYMNWRATLFEALEL